MSDSFEPGVVTSFNKGMRFSAGLVLAGFFVLMMGVMLTFSPNSSGRLEDGQFPKIQIFRSNSDSPNFERAAVRPRPEVRAELFFAFHSNLPLQFKFNFVSTRTKADAKFVGDLEGRTTIEPSSDVGGATCTFVTNRAPAVGIYNLTIDLEGANEPQKFVIHVS